MEDEEENNRLKKEKENETTEMTIVGKGRRENEEE